MTPPMALYGNKNAVQCLSYNSLIILLHVSFRVYLWVPGTIPLIGYLVMAIFTNWVAFHS